MRKLNIAAIRQGLYDVVIDDVGEKPDHRSMSGSTGAKMEKGKTSVNIGDTNTLLSQQYARNPAGAIENLEVKVNRVYDRQQVLAQDLQELQLIVNNLQENSRR